MKGALIWSAPGGSCIFFNDGHFSMAQAKEYKMFDKNFQVVWSLPFQIHHQVNSTNRQLLLLAYDSININSVPYRTDTLVVVDKSGKVEKQFYVKDHLPEIFGGENESILNSDFQKWPIEDDDTIPAKDEITHFNSFYEIPENLTARLIPAFTKGNYIANELISKKIYIINSDLKKILLTIHLQEILGDGGNSHDVQVLENGKILIYSNRPLNPDRFSTIDLYDPISGKLETLFKDSPPQRFFSKSKGGVQILPTGHLLVSNITSNLEIFEVNPLPKPHRVWHLDISTIDPSIKILNRARRYNLTDFLKENKKL